MPHTGPNWAEILTAFASALLSLSVIILAWQVWESKMQAQTEFEERLTRDYRELLKEIPTKALLGGELPDEQRAACVGLFFRYFNLTSAQVKLKRLGRIRESTWREWEPGVRANLQRSEFRRAWVVIQQASPGSFDLLQEYLTAHEQS